MTQRRAFRIDASHFNCNVWFLIGMFTIVPFLSLTRESIALFLRECYANLIKLWLPQREKEID